MTEGTITLPIAGPVKKTWVYVGGAVAAGIVGYAWWQHRQSAAAAGDTTEQLADYGGGVQLSGDGTTAGYNTGGGSTDTTPDDGTGPITTNAQWFQRAVDYLTNIGYDPQTVSSALGKYLDRAGLTQAEADIVRSAVGAVGTPPVGEFRIIIIGTPGTPAPPGGGTTPAPVPVPQPKPTPAPTYITVTVAAWRASNPPWNSTISGIAAHYGYGSNWGAVWNDPKNAGLRSKRGAPDKIRAGDTVYVKKK